MAYCTAADVIDNYDDDVLIQLTDDKDIGSIVTAVIDDAVMNTCGEIDGYLRRRYDLPLSETPAILKTYALDITLYRLYCRRQGPPKYLKKLYDDAISYLKLIASGKVDLDINIEDSTEEKSVLMSADNPPRLFTRSTMSYF